MDIKTLIIKKLKQKKEVRVPDIVKQTGFNRSYINKIFQELKDEGKIILIGKARNSRYVLARADLPEKAKKSILSFNTVIKKQKHNAFQTAEHEVFDKIKKETGILINLKENVLKITDYAFTEILNNALEHSGSDTIEVKMQRTNEEIRFDIIDRGIGIYNNIMKKFNLPNEMEAIGELMKGKLTTAQEAHSGEGIFFTSKAVDNMIIQSSNKKLIFNNIIGDIFIRDIKPYQGTKASCFISLKSQKNLTEIFNSYTDGDYDFSKTEVTVRLYKMSTDLVSRSQARRILTGLDKFKTIIMDFKDVKTVGQGFADEIFRVWKNSHPDIKLLPVNQNVNVDFMIKRAEQVN